MLSNCGAGEDSWESFGLQGDKSVYPKGNQPLTFVVKTDADDEAPILWLSDVKSLLIGKDPDAGKDWRQKEEWLRIRWLDRNTDTMDMNLSKLWEVVEDWGVWHPAVSMGLQRAQQDLATEQQLQII